MKTRRGSDDIVSWYDRLPVDDYVRRGIWGRRTIVEIFDANADTYPDKLAVADGSTRYTYRDLEEGSRRVARLLLDHGIGFGDAVALQAPSGVLGPLVHLACNRIGALYVPISSSWRALEVGSLVRTISARILFAVRTDGDFDLSEMHREISKDAPSLQTILYARTGDRGAFEDRVAAAAPATDEECAQHRPSADDPGHVMLSSGTTGVPKASVWSSNNVITLLLHQTAPALGVGAADVAGAFAPSNLGSTGYLFPILLPLLVGGTSIILDRWSAKAAVELLERERCSYATAVPAQMSLLLELPLESYDLSKFERFNNAGAPLSPEVARAIEERMGCRVQSVYGSTDGGAPVMTSISDPDPKRRGTVGRVLDGEELELRRSDGSVCEPGEPGEVCWRGANKSFGYMNQPDYDQAAWDDRGWFRSGDIGRFDDEGYLSIVGRSKDMILRGGSNVFPSEIEAVLSEHPSITQVSIVGIPDARLGERVCAVVVPKGAAPTLEDLVKFLNARGLARFKHPETLLIVDQIPMNAGGKVDKAHLVHLATAVEPHA